MFIQSDHTVISDACLSHIHQTPGISFWKDTQFRYRDLSECSAKLLGRELSLEIIGKMDVETPWAEESVKIKQHDQNTLRGIISTQLYFHKMRWEDDRKTLLAITKWPIYNKASSVMGVWLNCVEIPRVNFFYIDFEQEWTPFHDKSFACYVNNGDKDIYLTGRQAQCLHYLLHGYSAKQTALKLGISFRTVEDYVAALKHKFDCQHKSELIKKLWDCQHEISQTTALQGV